MPKDKVIDTLLLAKKLRDDTRNLKSKLEGFSIAEYAIIRLLSTVETHWTPSKLAKAIGKEATSFTVILDGLEKAGWITRVLPSSRAEDGDDRRSVQVILAVGKEGDAQALVERVEQRLKS